MLKRDADEDPARGAVADEEYGRERLLAGEQIRAPGRSPALRRRCRTRRRGSASSPDRPPRPAAPHASARRSARRSALPTRRSPSRGGAGRTRSGPRHPGRQRAATTSAVSLARPSGLETIRASETGSSRSASAAAWARPSGDRGTSIRWPRCCSGWDRVVRPCLVRTTIIARVYGGLAMRQCTGRAATVAETTSR